MDSAERSSPASPAKTSNRPKRAEKDSSSRWTFPRRRSRSPAAALLTPVQDVFEDRIRAWAIGRDDEGHLRGARKDCCAGTGKRIPRRRGRTCQQLGSPCYIPRRAPGRREKRSGPLGERAPKHRIVSAQGVVPVPFCFLPGIRLLDSGSDRPAREVHVAICRDVSARAAPRYFSPFRSPGILRASEGRAYLGIVACVVRPAGRSQPLKVRASAFPTS